MAKILKETATDQRIDELGARNWSTWECEPSTFDWTYSDHETAYVLEGKVRVTTPEQEIEIGAGDLVFFPGGLSCKWHVIEKIRKHYTFDLKDPIKA